MYSRGILGSWVAKMCLAHVSHTFVRSEPSFVITSYVSVPCSSSRCASSSRDT